jgi:glycine cleavage system H protein
MSSIPKDLRYTEDHEWVRGSDDPQVVEVGITDYAQGELGDVVFVELPKAAATFAKKAPFGTIEAVKAVSELYSPLAGTVLETNKALEQDPALVNRDPYGKGWMIRIKIKDSKELEGLLRADAYAKHIGE